MPRLYRPKEKIPPLLVPPSTNSYWNDTGFGPAENFATNPRLLWFVTDPTTPMSSKGGVTKEVCLQHGEWKNRMNIR